MGMTVIHEPFADGTCRHSGKELLSTIDYIMCSKAIVPLLGNFRILRDVAWSPHYAISVTVKDRPTSIQMEVEGGGELRASKRKSSRCDDEASDTGNPSQTDIPSIW